MPITVGRITHPRPIAPEPIRALVGPLALLRVDGAEGEVKEGAGGVVGGNVFNLSLTKLANEHGSLRPTLAPAPRHPRRPLF